MFGHVVVIVGEILLLLLILLFDWYFVGTFVANTFLSS